LMLSGAEWRWLCQLGEQARVDEVGGRVRGRY